MRFSPEEKKSMQKWTLLITFAVILFIVLWHLPQLFTILKGGFNILIPFIIGGMIAFIVNIPLTAIEHRLLHKWNPKHPGIKRVLSILVAFILIFVIILMVMFSVVPQLKETITAISDQLPQFIEKIQQMSALKPFSDQIVEFLNQLNLESIIESAQHFLQQNGRNIVSGLVSSVSSIFAIVFDIVLGLTFSVYLLASKEKLARQCKGLLYSFFPEKKADFVLSLFKMLNKNFHAFFTGQFFDAILLGVMCFIGMIIFRFPYALAISTLIGFTALIPIFGALIGALIGALLILMDSPIKALLFIVFLLTLQQFDGNVTYPRIVGNSVGLPSLWVLVAITVGGSVLGIIGMLIAVPIFGTIYELLALYKNKRLAINKVDIDKK